MTKDTYSSNAFSIVFHPVLLLCILIIYIYFKHSYKYWKSRGVPQLNPSFPFGDMADVIFRRQNMGDKIRDIYSYARQRGDKYVGLYFFSRKAFLPIDPVLIKNILTKDFNSFHDRGIYYDEKDDPLSAHLFSLAGPKWKNLRAKLTPAYSPKQLRGMFDIIMNCGLQMNEIIEETTNNGGPIEIKEILARYTTDVIGSCAFGLECNTMRNPNAEFRRMGRRAFTQTVGDVLKMIVIRSFPPLAKTLGIGVFSKNVTDFFRRVVRETIEYRESKNLNRNDFLQLLIQLKNNGRLEGSEEKPGTALTMDEAAAQAFIFFLAGFETTSTTSSFALLEMAMNYGVQEKARKEIENAMNRHGGVINYEAIQEFTYLDMIVQETMRKYPPAPVFLRKCTESYKIPDTDIVLEKGLSVLIPAYGMHKDPEYFPNPDEFDPERFNEENRAKIWDYTYIPFGDGPRLCIGMRFAMIQVKIALSLMLKNYTFRLNSRTKLPITMEKKGIILAPIGGIWIDFTEINRS
ncbi:hypothetical protein HHI36_017517 [Cryptolaemus montrouzieri]|uniref:Cytochrome P450 n=1 Tax=Cryptolaemus montrouzieri TaxID=559131 RepID=A0ABD2NN85_9CUCU